MFTGITPKEGFTVHFPDTGFKPVHSIMTLLQITGHTGFIQIN
ncbi:Uncharacterised protein [Escherichia coli]|nr:Uncharacterised protein [Escherichia coli]SVL22530.1 Uncharacterised protein [Klebsiella pneumoniae]